MIVENPICYLSKKTANRVCINSSCEKPAFICKSCQNDECEIHHLHNNKMEITRWTEISTYLSRVPATKTQIKPYYIQQLTNKIQTIIKQLQKLLAAHLEWFSTKTVMRFYDSFQFTLDKIKNKKSSEITGKEMKIFYDYLINESYIKKDASAQKEIKAEYEKLTKFVNGIKQKVDEFTGQPYRTKDIKIQKNQNIQKIQKNEKERSQEQNILDLTKQIQIASKDSNLYIKRANLYNQLKKFTEAEEDYSKAISLNPNQIQLYNKRAIFYKSLKKVQLAEQDYTTALKISPNSDKLYNNRGTLYQQSKKNNEALHDFTKAIELNPKNTDAYYNRGVLYHSVNRLKEAQVDYLKTLQLNPKDLNARSNLALLYTQINRLQEAQQEYTKVIQLNPDNRTAYMNRSSLYKRQGKIKQSEQDLKTAEALKNGKK